MAPHDGDPDVLSWRRATGPVLIGFLVVAGFFLVTEHRAHFFGILPWLLVLACPLMHLFMHHGHGGHHGHSGPPDSAPQGRRDGAGGAS